MSTSYIFFFHFPSPPPLATFLCYRPRRFSRSIVAILSSSLIRDDCLIPCLVFPLRAEMHEIRSLAARFRIILSRTPERAKVCKVFRWGVGTNERRAEILNASGKMEDKCTNGSFVMFHLDIEFSREFPVSR